MVVFGIRSDVVRGFILIIYFAQDRFARLAQRLKHTVCAVRRI